MWFKTLKIFLIIHFFVNYPVFSQNKTSQSLANPLVEKYNDWLRSIHLDTLIRATAFSPAKKINQTGAEGSTQMRNVSVLTLEPSLQISSRTDFASKWAEAVKNADSKDDIYQALFFKLADYSGSDPEKIAVKFSYQQAELFSFLIYFDSVIKVNSSFMDTRDVSGTSGPGDFDDNTVGGFFNNIPNQPDLNKRITLGLTAFLTSHKHTKPVKVDPKTWGAANLRLNAVNIEGEVTGNLHEIITVNVFIQPSANGYVNISFFFTVRCASGIFSAPSDPQLYNDALISYKERVSAYGIRLKEQLRSIIKAK